MRWHAADGFGIRRIDWSEPVEQPQRGSILFMPGRGDAYEKYLETYAYWNRHGWRVSAADWRGQAGSGRLGRDAVTGHVDSFDIWIADLAGLWHDWSAGRAGPLVLAGHSMGGHLVLRAVAEKVLSPQPDAVVLSAPLLGVHPQFLPLIVQRGVAGLMARIADPRRPAWKWSEKPGQVPAFRQRLLTHDPDRYADEMYWRRQRPELVMGPGSWGWIRAALRSIAALERPGVLESIDLPVFLMGTTADKLVSPRAIERAASRLPNAELLMFGEEAAHEILRESDPVRDRALAAIDSFLDVALQ